MLELIMITFFLIKKIFSSQYNVKFKTFGEIAQGEGESKYVVVF